MARTKKTNKVHDDVVHLTQEAYDSLVAELEEKRELATKIANDINEARELGDLRENAAYTDAMERKEYNDARIEELENLIATSEIVEHDEKNKDIVNLGSVIEIEKVSDKSKRTIQIVGKSTTQQADPTVGKISVDSPIGQAVHMAKIGDTVSVDLPSGPVQYKIRKAA